MDLMTAFKIINTPEPIIEAFNQAQNWQIIKRKGPNTPRTCGLTYLNFIYKEWLIPEMQNLLVESKFLTENTKKALGAAEHACELLTDALTLTKRRLSGMLTQQEGIDAVSKAYAAGIYSSIKVAKKPDASTIAEYESRVEAFKVVRCALDKIADELLHYGIVDAAGNISMA